MSQLPFCQIITNANSQSFALVPLVKNGQFLVGTADDDPRDPQQLWHCFEYFDVAGKASSGFAIVTYVHNTPLALTAYPDVVNPTLAPFALDGSNLWNLGDGISPHRDNNYCLTLHGDNGPWPTDVPLDIYRWTNKVNQRWKIVTVKPS